MAGLHARSRKLDIGVLKALTNFGLDLRATDNDGRTLVYHRAIAGSPTELLLALDRLAREEKKEKNINTITSQMAAPLLPRSWRMSSLLL